MHLSEAEVTYAYAMDIPLFLSKPLHIDPVKYLMCLLLNLKEHG